MAFVAVGAGDAEAIADLFRETFTASEGPDEGALVSSLAQRLLSETPAEDIHAFASETADAFTGAVIFSRMIYQDDPREVFILSPMAVVPAMQGRGVGQALIRYGLSALGASGVDAALTYGDPAFYGRVGFQPITTDIAAAPFPLSFPHGWLGQSLNGDELDPLKGRARCVPALADPSVW